MAFAKKTFTPEQIEAARLLYENPQTPLDEVAASMKITRRTRADRGMGLAAAHHFAAAKPGPGAQRIVRPQGQANPHRSQATQARGAPATRHDSPAGRFA